MKLKDCKIIVVTPFWQRQDISAIFWQGIEDLNTAGIDISVIAMVSDHKNEALAEQSAARVVYWPNDVLGMKWDIGVNQLRNHIFDYLCILGSDDICSPLLFNKLYKKHIESEIDYFGIKEALAMDMDTKKFRYWAGYTNNREGESLGVARMISRRALVECDFTLFPRDKKIGMDYPAHQKLVSHGFHNEILKTNMIPYRIGLKVSETLSHNRGTFMHEIDLKDYYSDKLIKML